MPRQLLAPLPPADAAGPAARPTFSIVIAAYQVAPYIGAALESAFSQTYPPVDVVVCDDGSTDEIEEAIAPYRDRIVFLRQENRGVGAAKNAAAHASGGEFIAVLDGDDIYLPGRLEALAEAAQARPDLDIVTTNAEIVLDGKVLRRAYDETWSFEVRDQRRAILERCFVIGHAAMRRAPFLAAGGFDETLRAVVDWDLWMRMILNGSRAGLVPEPLSQYRIRPGSISTDRTQVFANGLRCLEKARARDDLDAEERATVERTRADWRRRLALARARTALLAGAPNARRELVRVVFGRGYPATSRIKAAVSALSPRLAGSLLARREQQSWQGAAGVHVARTDGKR